MSLDLWSEIKKIWREIDILKSFDVPSASIITGWQNDIDTWTYASSTTLTITGDVTARFPVGTKIKLTQTTVKYFYVVSATYGAPNTTMTLTGGSDYSLANAAITLPYYSYAATPQGFPQWFNYAPSVNTGTCVLSGYSAARFAVIGRTVQFLFKADNKSMSGSAGTIKIGLPINLGASAPPGTTSHQLRAVYFISSYIDVRTDLDTSTPSVFVLYKDITSAGWLASETGVYIRVSGFYEI